MKKQTVYLETMGCQMNVLDSELILGQLINKGYESVDDILTADLVLINTCSVRDHAEQKVISRLGLLKKGKPKKPDMVVGVIGCMAERDPEGIFSKCPWVDFVCGPGELQQVMDMIEDVRSNRARLMAISSKPSAAEAGESSGRKLPANLGTPRYSRSQSVVERSLTYDSLEELDRSREPSEEGTLLQSYVRIQRGCDKFCAYCIVPYTRGPERCRPPELILEEAKKLVDCGSKEIILLGQTVNSYQYSENGQILRLADLLERIDAIEGLERLRFITSYPSDFSDDLFYAMRDLRTVCEYLHMPIQSGSDAVLKRMKRRHSVAEYEGILARGREIVPDITYAGDFIVGYCGETDEEFQQTSELLDRVRYKNIFCFKYSPRPGTLADNNTRDDVPDEVKRKRNVALLKQQEQISLEDNQKLVGQKVEVLVEGYSKAARKAQEAEIEGTLSEAEWRRTDQLVGRTRTDRIVVFSGTDEIAGQLQTVRIQSATALTLFGELDG